MSTVELKLSRSNRIYRPSELLQGKIIIKSSSSISHYGIHLTVNGSANLQVRGGSVGVIESLYGVIKPINILKKSSEIRTSGKIDSGTTEIPFSVKLRQPGEDNLERFYETFHGANINIQYLATVDIMRGYLHKSLSATVEFIVATDRADLIERPVSPEMVVFYVTQDTQRYPLLPELKSGGFKVTGKMSTQCSLLDPISGELTVEASAVPISSIDVHLLRVESILLGEKIVTETSLIQTTQIADGDVCRHMTLPIHVILPRLLTCPTLLAGPFSIEFKVTIVITFQSEVAKLHTKSEPTTPRLWDLHALSSKKGVFLVLHGASGLSVELIKGCIERGVRKLNVNTEVRKDYMDSLSSPKKDLIHVMASAKEAMKAAVVAEKMRLFGSAGKA